MRERCSMLIVHSRDTADSDKIASIFWSNGLLCQVLRGPERMAWYAYIRLGDLHPWLPHECRLERRVRIWADTAVLRRDYGDFDEVTAVSHSMMIRSSNPRVAIRDSRAVQPDCYWYQATVPKRNRKHYRLALRYMESLCCSMCSLLCYPP